MKIIQGKSILKMFSKLELMHNFLNSNSDFYFWDNIKSDNIFKSIQNIYLTPIINPLTDNLEFSVF